MSEENIKTNIDEVVFENRNKDYGAYYIRKSYPKYLTRALLIAITIIAALTIIPFFVFKEAHSVNSDKNVGAEFANLDQPKTDDAPPPPPPPPPEAIEQRVRFTAPVVTTDSVDEPMPNQEDLNQSSTNTQPNVEEEISVVEDNKDKGIEQQAPILLIVEVNPSFPGGEESMYKYLADNIKYPPQAKDNNVEGKVYVQFVVEPDGSISNVKCVKDIGAGCGDEAVRVVKAMPRWSPGKQNGTPARVQYNLPVLFTIAK